MRWVRWLLIPPAAVLIWILAFHWPHRSEQRPKSVSICFVAKDLGQQYWEVVRRGAFSAAKEFQVDLRFNWVGNETNVKGQISFLKQALRDRVKAVVLAPCDMNAVVPAIRELSQAGIPVVTVDSGVRSDLPVSAISTNNIVAGAKAARIMAQFIQGRGEVAVINHMPGTAAAIERERGFQHELARYPQIKIVSSRFCYGDPDRAETVTIDTIEQHPKLAGIFAVNEPSSLGAARALAETGQTGKIRLVGFDSSLAQIDFLENRVIDATIVQNPFTMGYLGVRTAVLAAQGKSVLHKYDTGSTVITRENMYMEENQKLLFPFEPIVISGNHTPAWIPMPVAISPAAKSAKEVTIGFATKSATNLFWPILIQGAKDAAHDLHAKLTIKGPSRENDLAGQLAIVEDLIGNRIDALVIAPCDSFGVAPAVQAAGGFGIPVIAVDTAVIGAHVTSFVATDNVKAAESAAEWIATQLKGTGGILLINGMLSQQTGRDRRDGFVNYLSRFYPGVHVIREISSDWDPQKAEAGLAKALQDQVVYDAIFCASDGITMGALKALRKADDKAHKFLVGFDAGPDALLEMKRGRVDADAAQFAYRMGYLAIKYAVYAARGKKIPSRIDTGSEVITPDNLHEFLKKAHMTLYD